MFILYKTKKNNLQWWIILQGDVKAFTYFSFRSRFIIPRPVHDKRHTIRMANASTLHRFDCSVCNGTRDAVLCILLNDGLRRYETRY
jgi:hypothetical protein